VTITTDTKIAATYVAFFDRAPDFEGLNFWRNAAQAGGLSDLELMKQLAAGFSEHPTFTSTYGGLSNADFIDAIYVNIGGQPADDAGRQNWLNELQGGMSRSDFVANFVFGLLSLTQETLDSLVASGEITQAEADGAAARTGRMLNKSNVALEFNRVLGEGSNLSPQTNPLDPAELEEDPTYRASVAIVSEVTEAPTSTEQPLSLLETNPSLGEVLEFYNIDLPAPGSKTFELTADVDDGTAFLGTENGDRYEAGLSLVGTQTLNSFDSLDGAGGTDRLAAILTGSTTTPTLTAIENLFVRAISDSGSTLDLAQSSGYEQLWTEGSQFDLTFDNVASRVTIGARNIDSALIDG
jgi:hypothetical protein